MAEVRRKFYVAGDGFVKAWPAAAGIEFVLRHENRIAAGGAAVGSVFAKAVVSAGKRSFGAFAAQNVILKRRQFPFPFLFIVRLFFLFFFHTHIVCAAGFQPLFFQVVLMIVFGRVESFGRGDFGNDWCRKFSGTVEFQYFGNGGFFLFGVKVKYGGSLLMSDVGTLAVPGGRIVDAEKNVE